MIKQLIPETGNWCSERFLTGDYYVTFWYPQKRTRLIFKFQLHDYDDSTQEYSDKEVST